MIFYAIIDDKVVPVHARMKLDTDLLSISGGETVFKLRVDGEVVDCRCAEKPLFKGLNVGIRSLWHKKHLH